jgi:hypothetical protein
MLRFKVLIKQKDEVFEIPLMRIDLAISKVRENIKKIYGKTIKYHIYDIQKQQ